MANSSHLGQIMLETERLTLRELRPADAPFILELTNEPAWLRFIGDKKIVSSADARHYILTGPVKMYQAHGIGLWRVELKNLGTPIGICGLIRRPVLPDIELGYALLAEYWHHGYAREAAEATLKDGRKVLNLRRVVAITTADNTASECLLHRLGFQFERPLKLPPDETELKLYAAQLSS